MRKLPVLFENNEWCCEVGCDHISPKLYENIYQCSWDKDGNLKSKKSEYYYTCQNNHALAVWDSEKCEIAELEDRFYKEVDRRNFDLDSVNVAISDLESTLEKYNKFRLSHEISKVFENAEVSYFLTLKSGEEFQMYLEDFKALRDQFIFEEKVA